MPGGPDIFLTDAKRERRSCIAVSLFLRFILFFRAAEPLAQQGLVAGEDLAGGLFEFVHQVLHGQALFLLSPDVQGEERSGLTVTDLLERFRAGAGKQLDNDRILLS